jgi:hypothetical protein
MWIVWKTFAISFSSVGLFSSATISRSSIPRFSLLAIKIFPQLPRQIPCETLVCPALRRASHLVQKAFISVGGIGKDRQWG